MNQEGEHLVNRITFQGNTTTRDNVIRRELRLLGDEINTEALKFSVKRIDRAGLLQAEIEEGSGLSSRSRSSQQEEQGGASR